MAIRFTVGAGHEFNYPADAKSADIIKMVGGRSKLSETDQLVVKYRTALEGEDCSDMPVEVRDLYVSRGWITVEDDSTVPEVIPPAQEAATPEPIVDETVGPVEENQ